MKVYLAGLQEAYTINYDVSKVKYALWSFPYSACRKDNHLIQPRENLIMDSGAFTFLNSQGTKGVNLDDYVVQYAEYLKTHSITQYVEMDVDSVTGYEKVKEYRRYLEKETNLPCILRAVRNIDIIRGRGGRATIHFHRFCGTNAAKNAIWNDNSASISQNVV